MEGWVNDAHEIKLQLVDVGRAHLHSTARDNMFVGPLKKGGARANAESSCATCMGQWGVAQGWGMQQNAAMELQTRHAV